MRKDFRCFSCGRYGILRAMETQFSRSEILLGAGSTGLLAQKKVAIFGIGGVGSFVAEALARAGIGHFLLVDRDEVSISNLNRQILALHSTLGRPKVSVMRERILDINPAAAVEARHCFYSAETAGEFDLSGFSYIADCVDTVSSKILLAQEGFRLGVPAISCMGAGNKLDPTRFEIADVYGTSVCPLARVMRRELKKRGVKALTVLYSREPPLKEGSTPAGESAEGSGAASENNGSRRPTTGSVPFVPSVAGLIIAGEIVKNLVGGR